VESAAAQAYFEQAAQLTRAARHDEAAQLLLRAIQGDPRKFEYFSRLMNISRRVSDKAAVVAALRKVIEQNRHCVPAFRALAQYCGLMGDIVGATEALRRGVRAKHARHAQDLGTSPTNPRFIIIGAEKCGTTSLYDDICRHPQVLSALEKEPYYFSEMYDRGRDWYMANFPHIREGSNLITGEASTMYLTDAHAAGRVAADLPNVRLLVIMRDPVARAVSQYNQLAKLGRIKKSLDQAFAAEFEVLRTAGDDLYGARQQCYEAGKACLWRSLYMIFVERWLGYFPPTQLLALRSEDYFGDAEATMGRVWMFLGLDPAQRASSISNQGEKTASISDSLTTQLRGYFEPFNRRLYGTLGWQRGWDG
jgi:hypothetical protein